MYLPACEVVLCLNYKKRLRNLSEAFWVKSVSVWVYNKQMLIISGIEDFLFHHVR